MRTDLSFMEEPMAFLDEWRRLYGQSDSRFFLSPAWAEAVIASAPKRKKLATVRVFDDLRGVYAMAFASASPNPFASLMRAARLQETGVEAVDRVYIEYNDILVARSAPDGARDAAVSALFDGLPETDEFVFRNATPNLTACVERAADARNLEIAFVKRQPTFAIDLAKGGDKGVMASFSSSLRSKIRRSIRRYEERGALSLKRPEGGAEKAVAWTELMRLHAQTWSRRGKRGVFNERAFCAFHERLIERYPENVDFVRLAAGDETIGVLYNFIERDRAYNYQSGFKYEAGNQLAPGFVCHALAAEAYRTAGFLVYDLMGGDSDYKRRLGEEGEMLTTIAVSRRNLRSQMRSALKSATTPRDAKKRQT